MMKTSRKHKPEDTGYIHSQEKKSYASPTFSCLIRRAHTQEMGPSVMGGPSHISKPISLDSTPLRLASCVILDSVYFCFIAGFGSFLPPCGSQQELLPLNHLTGPSVYLLCGNFSNSNYFSTMKTNFIIGILITEKRNTQVC